MGDSSAPVLRPTVLAPFRIGPDWLALSMRGPASLLHIPEPHPWIGGRTWVPTKHRTRVMSRVYYLLGRGGKKLMTVAGIPFSAAIGPPDWMQVQFENETLHTGEFVELYDTLRRMGFEYIGITRLDLAADGIEGNGGDFNEPLQRAFDGQAEYYGKMHWQPRYEGRKRVNGAALGTPASNKWFRVYDKTRELKTAGAAHKAKYIRAAWEATLGFDPALEGMTVNRFEFRTKGKEIRRYITEARTDDEADAAKFIESLLDQNTCADIFASMAARVYDFRTPAERARDAHKLVQWDFSAVREGQIHLTEREKRTLALSMQSIKTTCKTLWRTAYITQDHEWLAKAERIAQVEGLGRWIAASIPYWEKELQAIMQHAQTSGATEAIDGLYKLRGNRPTTWFDTPDNEPT